MSKHSRRFRRRNARSQSANRKRAGGKSRDQHQLQPVVKMGSAQLARGVPEGSPAEESVISAIGDTRAHKPERHLSLVQAEPVVVEAAFVDAEDDPEELDVPSCRTWYANENWGVLILPGCGSARVLSPQRAAEARRRHEERLSAILSD